MASVSADDSFHSSTARPKHHGTICDIDSSQRYRQFGVLLWRQSVFASTYRISHGNSVGGWHLDVFCNHCLHHGFFRYRLCQNRTSVDDAPRLVALQAPTLISISPSCSVSAARGALHSNCAGFHLGVRLAHPCPRRVPVPAMQISTATQPASA